MSNLSLRTAIVGAGKVGYIHAGILASLPESHFVAVCDRASDRAEAFARQYNVAAYDDVAAMVQAEQVDVVIICTPHPLHAEPARAALLAGAHVLVEKPLAANLADCDAILGAAHSAGRQLGVVSQRRFYRPVQRLKAAIDAGKIGQPILGTVVMHSWRDEAYYQSDPWRGRWDTEGGGVLVNQAPHQLDLLQWLMGPIESLYGHWANLNHPYIEVEDTAVAVIRFRSGALGNIIVSNSQKPGMYGKVHIHGSNGASVGVQTEGGAMFIAGMSSIQEPPFNDLWTVPGEEHLLETWRAEDAAYYADMDIAAHTLAQQDQEFLQAILAGRSPLVTGEEGRRIVEVFTAIYRSQASGAPVFWPLA